MLLYWDIIFIGLEILMLEAAGVRVIDTLNYLPMALAKLPKTFSLHEMKKGYFPHFFNTKVNWDYEGEIPDIQYYGADSMKDDDRASFLTWHEKQRSEGKIFNLQKELIEYCESDVNILAKSALKFRQIFITVSIF